VDTYDFIMAGGGIAGLSLAYHLSRSHSGSILIVDRDAKDKNDRTLSFWSRWPTLFDPIACQSWNRIRVAGENFEKTLDLGPYRYRTIRGLDFYRFVRQELSSRPNVRFLQGTIDSIQDGDGGAVVRAGGGSYGGEWVFDSRFQPSHFRPGPDHAHSFYEHFRGWEIETPAAAFDPGAATFMDFRAPQQNGLCFFYVLPYSACRALVECVSLSRDNPEQGLKAYIEETLKITNYRTISQESGACLLTNRSFPRRTGQHVMAIGAQGGRIKPSTGYAFTRIQRDSAAIVDSLHRSGHPFDVPPDPRFFHFCDTLMLTMLSHHNRWIVPLFLALFRHNPTGRIFKFLDEATSPRENLLLMASLVPQLSRLALAAH
jgi:lycopene beta-cyclase